MPVLYPVALTAACLVSVLVLLAVDRREWPLGRVIAKLSASTCFVGVAVALGAAGSTYGQLILGALVLGWMGDALLLSRAPKAFMGGLAAFLLSHVLFATAFVSGAQSVQVVGVAVVMAGLFGAGVLRWLMPHAPKEFKGPVLAYIVVILCMCVAAAGHAFASQRWAVLVGALLFTASDLSVARDRFVQPGFVNRLWGWPTYFVAQLVLAWTVATASAAG
jgi:uncharacterized membrane protein YhhN